MPHTQSLSQPSDAAGSAGPYERANRAFWDADAPRYVAEHGEYLGSFYWCPEMLHEQDAQLLGDTTDQRVLEIGCGTAPCTAWLQDKAALAVGIDFSAQMLARAASPAGSPQERRLPLVQADALALPFADACFDTVFSAFGAFPFIADAATALADAVRVLRPGGRFVLAVPHPMRWVFADDPDSLEVTESYFSRAYVEHDEDGVPTYAEFHRTMGDWLGLLQGTGLRIDRLFEPEWPTDLQQTWGQWSPLRGQYFPGTAIFVCHKELCHPQVGDLELDRAGQTA